MPLGNSVKPDIRKEAEERGLITAAKPDSHDICFIPDGDTAGFLHKKLGQDPGKIIDVETGEEIGEHDGVFEFTIGQRKGLHLENLAMIALVVSLWALTRRLKLSWLVYPQCLELMWLPQLI